MLPLAIQLSLFPPRDEKVRDWDDSDEEGSCLMSKEMEIASGRMTTK